MNAHIKDFQTVTEIHSVERILLTMENDQELQVIDREGTFEIYMENICIYPNGNDRIKLFTMKGK